MASLKEQIRYYRDELCEGIAWVAIYKKGRSWEMRCFWQEDGSYEDGLVFSSEDYAELVEISKIDHKAICINGYYNGLGADFTLAEIEGKVLYFYDGRMNQLQGDFLGGLAIPPEGFEN